MKQAIRTSLLLGLSSSVCLMAGGEIKRPVEPTSIVPKKEVIIVANPDSVKYDGFYTGAALGYMQMNEAVLSSAYGLTLMGGYYFNKYFGVELRYSQSITDMDVDSGITRTTRDDTMSNVGIYFKPMYNLTTGFSIYGLAGYGESTYEKKGKEYSESGAQWGLGAKYELDNGVGLFFDYLDIYSGKDNYDGLFAEDILFNSMNVGATYTF